MNAWSLRLMMVVFGVVFATTDVSLAQSDSSLGPMFDPRINTTPQGSVITAGIRAPGVMVNTGVARTLIRTRQAQSTIEISEQWEPDAFDDFVDEAEEIIIDQVTELFFYFTNLLLERAGLPTIEVPTNPIVDDDGDTGRPDKPGGR